MSNSEFATLFNDLLAGKDFSAADLAHRTGLDEGTISKWANPQWNPKPKRESLLKLRDRGGFTDAEVNRLLAAVGHSPLSPQEISPLPPLTDLDRYLRHVRDRQAILDFSIFQEGQEREFAYVPLDSFYIPLRLAGQPRDEAARSAMPRQRSTSPLLTEREATGEHYLRSDRLLASDTRLGRHLALLGDAGSGKTTILRQLTGALAHAWVEKDPPALPTSAPAWRVTCGCPYLYRCAIFITSAGLHPGEPLSWEISLTSCPAIFGSSLASL